MPGVSHSTRVGSIGIHSGSVGITDGRLTGGSIGIQEGDIHITSGSVDASVIGSLPVYRQGSFWPAVQEISGTVQSHVVSGSLTLKNNSQTQITDGVTIAGVDSKSKAFETIHVIHHNIHIGSMFSVSHIFDNVPSNGTADFLLVPGTTLSPHMKYEINGLGEAFTRLYEGGSFSTKGSNLMLFNRNRNISQNTSSQAYYHPTVDYLGTLLNDVILPSGATTPTRAGGQATIETEWVLSKSKKYLIRILNRSSSTNDLSVDMEFYESS